MEECCKCYGLVKTEVKEEGFSEEENKNTAETSSLLDRASKL